MVVSLRALNLDRVTKVFGGTDRRAVIRELTLELRADQITSIVGPNGSGKSTTLHLIAGVLTPDSGSIRTDPAGTAFVRTAYVWQDYRASLLPWASALENVALPLLLQGMPRGERKRRASELLGRHTPSIDVRKRCGLLSGGEQQKVAILRCLAADPDLLLLDEPFSALDLTSRWQMMRTLEAQWQERQVPTVFVSHDLDESILFGDQVVLLGTGRPPLVLVNPLPRPRTPEMLVSAEHLQVRDAALRYLLEDAHPDIGKVYPIAASKEAL